MQSLLISSNANIKQSNKNSNGVCYNISEANIISSMKRRDLTPEELIESGRLKAIYEARKDEARALGKRLTQTDIAEQCGWSNQSAFSQFANGRIPLNLEALLKLSNVLKFDIADVSPRLAKLIGNTSISKKLDQVEILSEIGAWDDATPLDNDEIEIPVIKEIELSVGNGSIPIHEHKMKAKLSFDKATLSKLGVDYTKSICLIVSGNSMEPFIPDGAAVGIDTANTNIVDGKIYAIVIDNDLVRLKLLYQLPGNKVRLRSFNRDEYEDEDYSLEEIRVIGKMFWSSVLWN